MPDKKHWESRYEQNSTPWDTGEPDSHLVDTVKYNAILPGKALEIGCGTGTNAIWMARQGFSVTANDISPLAIEKAREKAKKNGLKINFIVSDFLNDKTEGGPFSFVFDRGCFHSFEIDDDRSTFARKISGVIDKQGHWLSIIGSCDSPPRETGPPMRSAKNIIDAVEPHFEILELRAILLDSKLSKPPPAWKCLMKKREFYS
ncbi:class I SAM-dependent methyltransferase [Spirochaetota bacterium]